MKFPMSKLMTDDVSPLPNRYDGLIHYEVNYG